MAKPDVPPGNPDKPDKPDKPGKPPTETQIFEFLASTGVFVLEGSMMTIEEGPI